MVMSQLLAASRGRFLHTLQKAMNWQAQHSETDKNLVVYDSKESWDLAGYGGLVVKPSWGHVDKHYMQVHSVAAFVREVMPSVKC
jgi:hypothetical protein